MMSRFSFAPLVWVLGLLALLSAGSARAATLFDRGTTWAYFKGRTEATPEKVAQWRSPTFDPTGWSSGPAPFFYGEIATGTELTDMRGGYTSVFLRRFFTVTGAGDISELRLGAAVDDGFIAWINGQEVARVNVPEGDLAFNAVALSAAPEPIAFQTYVITNVAGLLTEGNNLLSVQLFNTSLGDSTDIYWDASLSTVVDTEAPRIEEVTPPPGSVLRELPSIEVRFSEPVDGVEAADLLLNGQPATNVTEVAAGQFLFTFPKLPAGDVTVTWRAGHGITDRGLAKHPFSAIAWTYKLSPDGVIADVIISEFMAANDKSLRDEDGENSDWIELANTGVAPVNLAGWFLTDDGKELPKWRFPAVTIQPRGFLVVFASGKNRTNNLARLHTGFKLTDEGEYLALVSPTTNVISAFAPAFPKQFVDISYGRAPGAPDQTGYFTKATPGAQNSTTGAGFAPPVGFSRPAGTFTTAFQLALSAPGSNVVIRYTLNGTMPTNTSTIYTGPLTIGASTQVRARAFADGLLPGEPVSRGYVMLNNNVTAAGSDLPFVILHTMGSGSPTSSRQTFAQLSIHEPVNGRSSLTNPPTLTTRAAIKIRGSSTEGLPKASFSLELWDEFNFDQNQSLLGLPKDSDWVLYAPNSFEPVMIHNPFMHQLSRDIGRYSPRTRFVEVYLASNGAISSTSYNGIYVLEEKITIGKDRVNIDKLEPENTAAPEVTGGYLVKIDRLDPGDGGLNAGGQSMGYIDPKETEIETAQRTAQRNYITSYFNNFNSALNNNTIWRDPARGYEAFIDTDAWIDHHLLNVLSANADCLRLSTYLHKPRNGKITFGPLWDFDRALGSTDGRDANPRLWGGGGSDYFFNYTWWGRLFRDTNYVQRYVDRYQDLRAGRFSTPSLLNLVDSLANQLRQAQPRERSRWQVSPRGGSYQSEINLIRNWLSNRVAFIDTNFVRQPSVVTPGGFMGAGSTVSLTVPTNTTVYYTLDGSDPRLRDGLISPSAKAYAGPITISTNARLVARSHQPNFRPRIYADGPPIVTPWSGPVSALYTVEAPALIVTEVMFHPVTGGVEYLELKNTGARTVNLTGYRFVNGIDFTFGPGNGVTELAPGARVIVTASRAAFAARYPGVTNVAGDYLGALSNGGNRLRLVGPVGEPVFDFSYSDQWQALADGFGFSLVLANETIAADRLSEAGSWRLSASPGGSPGALDPAPPVLPRVVVNEALPRPIPPLVDAIELYNPGATSADLSGWYLTDDFRTPKKYRIANGTSLAAGGYLVFTESQFGGNGTNAFALSALGDEVYLFSADARGELTGWVHGFDLGVALPGDSFGRVVTSTGAEDFVVQTRPTPGLPNSGPRVGPVIVSEIMYSPVTAGMVNDTVDEYVELRNLTGEAVALFDPVHPTNTWHLRGGIDFDFPPNLTLPPRGRLLVTSFNPQAETEILKRFQALYGLDETVTILGPWTGRLDNAGDEVELERPDSPLAAPAANAGFVPYALVEEVEYGVIAPWPAGARETGLPLFRKEPAGYANDPASWTAGRPEPELRLSVQWSGAATVNLRVTGAANRAYTLEYQDRLGSAWQVLRVVQTDASGVASGQVAIPAAGERYYRATNP